MGKQIGVIPLTGTPGGIPFYIMKGKGYARKSTSLDRKRVTTDPRFANTMRSAGRFGAGSRVGSKIYQKYFSGLKDKKKYNQLTGEATLLLKKGMDEAVVLRKMEKKYGASKPIKVKRKRKSMKNSVASKKVRKKIGKNGRRGSQ